MPIAPPPQQKLAIFGANGTIGSAMISQLCARDDVGALAAFSRTKTSFSSPKVESISLDYLDETALAKEAHKLKTQGGLSAVLVATGILHHDQIMPEKSLKELNFEKFQTLFQVNTVVPTLIAKHFLPLLPRKEEGRFGVLSARVGSISDNRLGGWYSYRSSKAALNMIVKCAAIETARSRPKSIVVGLHPGTVDSPLSQPFQRHVKPEQLFTPEFSAQKLLDVFFALTPQDSGKCFDWQGLEIQP